MSYQKVLVDLEKEFADLAEEFMFFGDVTRRDFAATAVRVANNYVYGDDRDLEEEVTLEEPSAPSGSND